MDGQPELGFCSNCWSIFFVSASESPWLNRDRLPVPTCFQPFFGGGGGGGSGGVGWGGSIGGFGGVSSLIALVSASDNFEAKPAARANSSVQSMDRTS